MCVYLSISQQMQVKICVLWNYRINLNCKTVKILFMSRKHVVDVKHGTSRPIEQNMGRIASWLKILRSLPLPEMIFFMI